VYFASWAWRGLTRVYLRFAFCPATPVQASDFDGLGLASLRQHRPRKLAGVRLLTQGNAGNSAGRSPGLSYWLSPRRIFALGGGGLEVRDIRCSSFEDPRHYAPCS